MQNNIMVVFGGGEKERWARNDQKFKNILILKKIKQ